LAIDPIVPRIEMKLARAMPACRWAAIYNRRRPPTPDPSPPQERVGGEKGKFFAVTDFVICESRDLAPAHIATALN
jgi:hypothetical protein